MNNLWTSSQIKSLLKVEEFRSGVKAMVDTLSRQPKVKGHVSKVIIDLLHKIEDFIVSLDKGIKRK